MRFVILITFFVSNLSLAQTTDIDRLKIDSGYFKSFDDSKIYYEVRGKGEPVVLVHGFIVNGESWKRTALYNDLLTSGYKVITFDMRGNGRSDKPHVPEAYANDAEAKDIMALLGYLGIRSYKAVGYSRGAIIVSRLLVLDKRATAGVMGGMGADFTNPEWPRRVMFYEALMGKQFDELEGMKKYVRSQKLDTIALAYLQKEQPSTSPGELKSIKQKVLIVKGEDDIDNGSAEELSRLVPGSIYRTTPGVHNDANKTKEFSTVIINFFKGKSVKSQ
jgi:pimeloyl-ACP methyl ester carboxylesterase